MKFLKNILCAATMALCAGIASLHGAQLQPDDKVKLVCCGNDEILLEVKYAQISETLKHIADELTQDDLKTPFPTMPIRKEILEKYIIPALKAIQQSDNGSKETLAMLVLKKTFAIMPLEDLIELIINANYLDIKPLLDAAMTVLEIRVPQEKITTLKKIFETKKIPKDLEALISDKILKNCKAPYANCNPLYFTDGRVSGDQFGDKDHYFVFTSLLSNTCGKTPFCCSRYNTYHSGKSVIKIWNLSESKVLYTFECDGFSRIMISPDSKFFSSTAYGSIAIWDLLDSNEPIFIKTLEDETLKTRFAHLVTVMCISHDNKRVFSAHIDNKIRVWDVETGTLIQTLEGHTKIINALCVTPDCTKLFSGSEDETVFIWDLKNLDNPPQKFDLEQRKVKSLCVSFDGKTLFSASSDGKIFMWDIEFNKFRGTMSVYHNADVNSLCIDPEDGTLFSSAMYPDKTIGISKLLTLNKAYNKEKYAATNLIMQAWLITQILNCSQNYDISQSPVIEEIWSTLPFQTQRLLSDHHRVKLSFKSSFALKAKLFGDTIGKKISQLFKK